MLVFPCCCFDEWRKSYSLIKAEGASVDSDIRWFYEKLFSLFIHFYVLFIFHWTCLVFINLMTAFHDDSIGNWRHDILLKLCRLRYKAISSLTTFDRRHRRSDTILENSISFWRINCFLIASILWRTQYHLKPSSSSREIHRSLIAFSHHQR